MYRGGFRHRLRLAAGIAPRYARGVGMFAMILGYQVPDFPGSQWVSPLLGTVMYLWGGRPFLTGAISEIRSRTPGMMLLIGLVMALSLVGLAVGWPLMAPTISAEGTDSWEALSRSFSYVFQRPWHYLWYGLVAVAYGAVVIFFIGFMGSFIVYLSKWGVSKTPWIETAGREPSFLFIYSPTSFGWRDLLLANAQYEGRGGGQGRVLAAQHRAAAAPAGARGRRGRTARAEAHAQRERPTG